MKKPEKTIKPSQRKSITEFTSTYGDGFELKEKQRIRKFFTIAATVAILVLIMYFGYFIADILIGITEVPIK